MSDVAMLSAQKAEAGLLLGTDSSDISSSVVNGTIVQKNCLLHFRGNLLGNLTIEPDAEVIVEGSVAGKILNRGGSLAVNHKAACDVFGWHWFRSDTLTAFPDRKVAIRCKRFWRSPVSDRWASLDVSAADRYN